MTKKVQLAHGAVLAIRVHTNGGGCMVVLDFHLPQRGYVNVATPLRIDNFLTSLTGPWLRVRPSTVPGYDALVPEPEGIARLEKYLAGQMLHVPWPPNKYLHRRDLAAFLRQAYGEYRDRELSRHIVGRLQETLVAAVHEGYEQGRRYPRDEQHQ